MSKLAAIALALAGALVAGGALAEAEGPTRPVGGQTGDSPGAAPDREDLAGLRPPVLTDALRRAMAGRFQPGSTYGRVSTTTPTVEGRLGLVYHAPKRVSFGSWTTPFGPAATGSAVQLRLKAAAARRLLVACAVHATAPPVDAAAAQAAATAAAQAQKAGLPPPAPAPTSHDFVLAMPGSTTTTAIPHGTIGWVSGVLQTPSDAWQDVRLSASGDWSFLFCEAVFVE